MTLASANALTALTQVLTSKHSERGANLKKLEEVPQYVVIAPAMDVRRNTALATVAAKGAQQAAIVQTV